MLNLPGVVRNAYSGSAEGSRERLRRSSSGLLHAELEQFGAIILEAAYDESPSISFRGRFVIL